MLIAVLKFSSVSIAISQTVLPPALLEAIPPLTLVHIIVGVMNCSFSMHLAIFVRLPYVA